MKRIGFFLTIGLLGGIAAFGYWYTSFNKKEFDHSAWLVRSFDGVRSIHVQSALGTYMMTCEGDMWEAQVSGSTQNITARALSAKVEDFLQYLVELEPNLSIRGLDRGGADDYGLARPKLKIIITTSNETAEPLVVKMASDGAGTVYGWNSLNKGVVYEFGSKALEQLQRPVVEFLDHNVFNFEQDKVDKVQLVQPFGSSWLVEKQKQGYFFSLPGYLKGKPASDSKLKLYLNSLELLKVGTLVLDPVTVDRQLPILTVKVWPEGAAEPKEVHFYTIDDNPEVYLGKSSWLTVPFTLDAQSVKQLTRSAFDVQGRSVISLDLGAVTFFTVKHGDSSYTVKRGPDGWSFLGNKKFVQGIDMFLWRFTELQFEALPLNNLPDTAVQLMHCIFFGENGRMLTELTFFADPKLPQGQCWMKSGGGMYYPVSSRLLKDLQGIFPSGSSGSGA